MACFVYEGVLLFGVVMAAGFVYATITQQRHALSGTRGLQIVLFLVLGAYFAGVWTRSGQTLAMQTWQIKIVAAESGRPPGWARACARYLLAWLWFVPALVGLNLAGLKDPGPSFGVIAIGVAGYASLVWLRPDRQFLHDALCGTRILAAPRSK